MAPRIGYTMAALRAMGPASCDTDARLVWKKDDEWNLGVLYHSGNLVELRGFCGTREMRLLAAQLLAHADELDRESDPHEELLP